MQESAGNSKEKLNRKKRRRKREAKVFALLFLVIACLGALVFTVVVVLMDNGIIRINRLETAKQNVENKTSETQTENLEVTVIEETENDSSAGGGADEVHHAATQNGLPKEVGTTDTASETDSAKENNVKDVTMIFAGDICFYDAFANMSALRSRGGNIESSVDEKLLAKMRDADICMVNNEFAYSDRGTPLVGKTYTFRSNPSNVGLLSDMGVDLVSLANNHVYDYGEDALLDTLEIGRAHV